jgi:TIR domain
MPHDVFVSYASDDKPTADAVCATLENKGIRCWIAPRDILPGIDWGGAIVDAIHASRVMVLVYSAKANDSGQIKREVERAVNGGLTVIPFRIEDVPMSRTLEYFMSMPHWLDALTPPLQDHLDRLAETVRIILERDGAVLASPPGGQTTASTPPGRPLTTSRDIAALRQSRDRGSHRDMRHRHLDPRPGAGRRDLAPAAGRASHGRRSGQSSGWSGGGHLYRPRDHRASGLGPRGQCLDQPEQRRTLCPVWPWICRGADRGCFRRRLAQRTPTMGPPSRERFAPGAHRNRDHVYPRIRVARGHGPAHAANGRADGGIAVDPDARDHGRCSGVRFATFVGCGGGSPARGIRAHVSGSHGTGDDGRNNAHTLAAVIGWGYFCPFRSAFDAASSLRGVTLSGSTRIIK